uniref:Mono(ADP-ribosyl)transferase n=1 Tax=Emiliania huxleyi TaxID=2903 RepID=A0A6V2X9S2_EMIHU
MGSCSSTQVMDESQEASSNGSGQTETTSPVTTDAAVVASEGPEAERKFNPGEAQEHLAVLAAANELAPALAAARREPGSVDVLRKLLLALNVTGEAAVGSIALTEGRIARATSTRSGFVRTLEECIGPRPESDWRDEWLALNVATVQHTDPQLSANEAELKARKFLVGKNLEKTDPSEFDRLISSNKPADLMRNKFERLKSKYEWQVQAGWTPEAAEAHVVLSGVTGQVLARELQAGSSRFAASSYALTDALVAAARLQGNTVPEPVYAPLFGTDLALASKDRRWQDIEKPDEYGFRGFTCAAEVNPQKPSSEMFPADGAEMRVKELGWKPLKTPAVRFVSRTKDDSGFHAVVQSSEEAFRVPPNTLCKLLAVYEPGEWEVCGVKPGCRLLEVGITYILTHGNDVSDGVTGSKLNSSVRMLSFADRSAYIRGVHELTRTLVLTMEQEWQRGDTWTARNGQQHSGCDEWAYVVGTAGAMSSEKRTETFAGKRDEGENHGLSVEQFMKRTRDDMRARAAKLKIHLEEADYLSRDEVLSLRLYTGPGYQPINEWLRNIGRLDGPLRVRLARSPGLTYSATLLHISSAIRKLARVSMPEERSRTLWRGIVGELPHTFWRADRAGLLCVTDLGLMSTSTGKDTPIKYMDGMGANVLWEIHADEEDDAGFHCGVDVSLLSQFAGEKEVLFPPLTMLQVMPKEGATEGKDGEETWRVVSEEDGAKRFKRIAVRPTFV